MGGSFKIGQAFGIVVKVHWTFFLLLAFFAFVGYQGGGLLGALVTVAFIVMLFFSVLLHEFGHSLVAQWLGIKIRDITLLPIGGVSNMRAPPEKPSEEIKITMAGPLVNVVLAPIFFGVGFTLGVHPANTASPFVGGFSSVGQFFAYLGVINVLLAIFNLLPAFPMDGGRVLRGLLATRLGWIRATEIASAVGQAFALGFFFFGLLSGNIILALIAVFIFFGASGEAQMVRQREQARGLRVSDVMGTRPRTETVTPYHNLGQVLDTVVHGYQEDFPVVEEDGRLVGMLTRMEIFSATRSPDRFRDVRDLMRTKFPTISSEADLFEEGHRILQESGLHAIPVMDNERLVGMLTIEDIGQANLLRSFRGSAGE